MKEIQSQKIQSQKKKKHIKPWNHTWFFLSMLFLILILLAHATLNVFFKERESAYNMIEARKQLDDLAHRRDVLKEQTQRLNTKEGIEQSIREKFQVSKEGEGVMVVITKDVTTSTLATTSESLFSQIRSYFFPKK